MLNTDLPPPPTQRRKLCREIPVDVVSSANGKLRNVPLTTGICLPKGQLFETGEWIVDGFGGAQAMVQSEVLNRWSDGSARWLLTQFVAPRVLPGRTTCVLHRSGQTARIQLPPVSLQCDENQLQLSLPKVGRTAASSVVLVPELYDGDGKLLPLHVEGIANVQNGAVVCTADVTVSVGGQQHPEILIRLEIWPAAGLVKVATRIRNAQRARHSGGLWDLGDPGSFHFRALNLKLESCAGCDEATWRWKEERCGLVQSSNASDPVRIRQYGSGGPAWSNGNHRDRHGHSTVRERGYQVQSASGTRRGYRSEPVVAMVCGHQQLTAAVPEFWQQFPSGIVLGDSRILVEHFPVTGGPYELQGGEQKTSTVWVSTRADDDLRQLDWVSQPPRLIQPATWIKEAGVFNWLPECQQQGSHADDEESAAHSRCHAQKLARIQQYLCEATTGTQSMASRRDRADEYGWRHFGDVHADHEQPHYDGFHTLASHYNNQFDMIFGGILNLAVSGDAKWFDLFDPLARHVIDIDIYHTDKDRSCFNGGLFWHTDHFVDAHTSTHRTYSRHNSTDRKNYGGGPSNEHNYTTGLLYYHFLTGSQDAREAVLSLADWVIAMDDGSKTIWGAFDSGPTGLASQTVYEHFHGPGRGAGNSINALLDAWILTRREDYLSAAEGLIRRVVHPQQNCTELHLSDAEGHWSYTVCLVAIGRYLDVKLEAAQLDEHYAYARDVMQNFGRWMLHHEKPALLEPEKLTLPTVAWAAQEFRKANALRIAACCVDDADLETKMRCRADELNDAAWKDLYSFGEMHLTARCLSILMTEGLRDVFHRSSRPEYFPPTKGHYEWEAWTMFVPQKQRVRQLLRNPVQALLACGRLLQPRRMLQTIDAVRRQF